jgi:hypothetical protein
LRTFGDAKKPPFRGAGFGGVFSVQSEHLGFAGSVAVADLDSDDPAAVELVGGGVCGEGAGVGFAEVVDGVAGVQVGGCGVHVII